MKKNPIFILNKKLPRKINNQTASIMYYSYLKPHFHVQLTIKIKHNDFHKQNNKKKKSATSNVNRPDSVLWSGSNNGVQNAPGPLSCTSVCLATECKQASTQFSGLMLVWPIFQHGSASCRLMRGRQEGGGQHRTT